MKQVLVGLLLMVATGACVLRSGDANQPNARTGDVTGMQVNVYRTDQPTYPRPIANPYSMPVIVTLDERPIGWLAAFSSTYLRLPAGEFVVGFKTMQGFPLDQRVVAFGPSESRQPRR